MTGLQSVDHAAEVGRLTAAIEVALDSFRRGYSPMSIRDGLAAALIANERRRLADERDAAIVASFPPSADAPRAHTGD